MTRLHNETVAQLSRRMFADIAAMSPDVAGVSRPAYSTVESATLAYLEAVALTEGLEVWYDEGRNLYAALPGTRDANGIMLVGSHVDSVPQGGNFDGLAGVIAGLSVLFRAQREGITPEKPVHVVAMRGEESPWFGPCYIGSRIITGTLTQEELAATHRGDGRSLAEHLGDLGIPVEKVSASEPMLDLSRIAGYLELHIEQGPVLIEKDAPIAAVSGIRGNMRYREVACRGVAGHSGAVPQNLRQDALLAVSDLLARMERHVEDSLEQGADLVFTSGMIGTDPAKHAVTRIPDEVFFSIDIRSLDQATLEQTHEVLLREMAVIGQRRGVRFEAGDMQHAPPANCSPALVDDLKLAMLRRRIRPLVMASGAGHDAAVFAEAGIPTAMIFVRNENGSHNPDEAMDYGDFEIGCETLYGLLCHDPLEAALDNANPPVFADLAQTVRQHGGGTYAFEAAAKAAHTLAVTHPGHAVGLNLAAMAASQVARRFDDQAITASQAAAQLEEYERRLATLDAVVAEPDAARRLQMLNDLAAQLLDVERNEK